VDAYCSSFNFGHVIIISLTLLAPGRYFHQIYRERDRKGRLSFQEREGDDLRHITGNPMV